MTYQFSSYIFTLVKRWFSPTKGKLLWNAMFREDAR